MSASYLPWNRGQTFLFPPSPEDWLPEGHLARFVLDVVDRLDLSSIYARIEGERAPQGRRAFPPELMVSLLLYAYMTGTTSSRVIERKSYEDVGYRFICGDLHPNFRTLGTFRRRHLESLPGLFEQSVQLCIQAGLVDLDLVAIDGTKVLASASKRKAMSYGRMMKERSRLQARIAELLAQAEAIDAAEDEAYGDADALPVVRAELRDASARKAFIEKHLAQLEEDSRKSRAAHLRRRAVELDQKAETEPRPRHAKAHRTNAEKRKKAADDLDDDPPPPPAPTDMPTAGPPTTPEGKPKSKAQRNFTDPDSRIMVHDGSFVQAFNAQAAVDSKTQIIVAQGVSNNVADLQHFQPMAQRVLQVLRGRRPDVLVADAGYWTAGNESIADAPDIDVFIAVERMRRTPDREPSRKPPPARGSPKDLMKQKTETTRGKALLITRRTTAEPPFGHIKEARGFRRFSMRGLQKVRAEWALVTACHNLMKLFRHHWAPVPA